MIISHHLSVDIYIYKLWTFVDVCPHLGGVGCEWCKTIFAHLRIPYKRVEFK
jgi:hypothetical protein